MVDGVLSSDPEDIAECISQFYRQLYAENVDQISGENGFCVAFLLLNFPY